MTTDERAMGTSTTRSPKRPVIILMVGGFLVGLLPRAVIGMVSGEPTRQIAAVVWIGFWAWLIWRLVVRYRHPDAGRDRTYWLVSAAGFGVFALIYLVFEIIDATRGSFDARSLPLTIFAVLLAMGYAANGLRIKRAQAGPDDVGR
ncbi:hypothetical protein [Nocardioides sp. GXZ039]|uniref:hypothetical protein n=1 Tax=Nocardioides sp. GXZ039 TaxID=3136018 RepID=UPI0030F4994A